jgi:hypothetical protein
MMMVQAAKVGPGVGKRRRVQLIDEGSICYKERAEQCEGQKIRKQERREDRIKKCRASRKEEGLELKNTQNRGQRRADPIEGKAHTPKFAGPCFAPSTGAVTV